MLTKKCYKTERNMRTYLYISLLFVLALFASCSPQKRLQRLVRLYPELITTDTIHIQDSFFIPEIRLDTFFSEKQLLDTITLTKEKLSVQLLKTHDTIFLDAWHEPDTVVIEKSIPIEKVQYVETCTFLDFWKKYRIWFLVGVVVLLVVCFFRVSS